MKSEGKKYQATEENSGETIPMYTENPADDPQTKMLKRMHNKFAQDAVDASEKAKADTIGFTKKFVPAFKLIKFFKQIPSIATIVLGIVTVLSSIVIFQKLGSTIVTPEMIGLFSAGIGIALSGLISFMSFEDDTLLMLSAARAEQKTILADLLMIKTQLSFIKIELIYSKKKSYSETEENTLSRLGN